MNWQCGKANIVLILDTHALIWILLGSAKLGPRQIALINAPATTIYVSAVSGYEIAYKHRIGKLPGATELIALAMRDFEDFDWKLMPITLKQATLAGSLTGIHRDPFDRLLAAQSIVEGLPIMTVDEKIGELGAKVVW
jgi:PIN domain nuclease of toxin-antitoxin system